MTTALPPSAAGNDVCHPLVHLASILRHTLRLPTAALAGPCATLVGTCTADDVDLAARPPAPLVPTNVRLSGGEVEVMVPGSLSAPISIIRREHPRHPDLQYIALPGNIVLGSYPERPGLPWLVHNRRSRWGGIFYSSSGACGEPLHFPLCIRPWVVSFRSGWAFGSLGCVSALCFGPCFPFFVG